MMKKLEEVDHPVIREAQIRLLVLRDDLVHPFINGNKRRKLKYNLEDFRQSGKKALLTFGGTYSNHLVAVAAAGKEFNIRTIGIVRGEEDLENEYIRLMQRCGMELLFISRDLYRRKDDPAVISGLIDQVNVHFSKNILNPNDVFLIPEGGSNPAAVKGCIEIVNDLSESADIIACACGTGATLAGISCGLRPGQEAIGVAVLRGENFLMKNVSRYSGDTQHTQILFDYHFGGYAKRPPELLRFCEAFTRQTGIPVEPIYTGKLFFGILDLAGKDFFKKGSTIAAIHTGGIFEFEKKH